MGGAYSVVDHILKKNQEDYSSTHYLKAVIIFILKTVIQTKFIFAKKKFNATAHFITLQKETNKYKWVTEE